MRRRDGNRFGLKAEGDHLREKDLPKVRRKWNRRNTSTLGGLVCIVVLCGTLVAGLWPFHSPKNEVFWLTDHNGLRFGHHGTVISTGPLTLLSSPSVDAWSIELWLEPRLTDQSGTILTFYAPDHLLQLSVGQSLTDLSVQLSKSPKRQIYFSDVFNHGRDVFVTITFSSEGISAFLDGTLIRSAGPLPFAVDRSAGRLIIGDSVREQNPWSGQVRGVAIYARQLAPESIPRHFRTWTQTGRPEVTPEDRAAAVYLFDERAGSIVHNQVRAETNLLIPSTYIVLDKWFLEPFWDEFEMSWSYWRNVLKNIFGFVPLGFCFCAYFVLIRRNERAAVITVILGFAVSLIIEVLQGYLPTRDSGTTDLITNSLGTWLGVSIFNFLTRTSTVVLGCSTEPGGN